MRRARCVPATAPQHASLNVGGVRQIAALATSLGNVVPATGHWDAGGRWHNDLLWALGEHPFGPLTNRSGFSQVRSSG